MLMREGTHSPNMLAGALAGEGEGGATGIGIPSSAKRPPGCPPLPVGVGLLTTIGITTSCVKPWEGG